jgi:hypothetical protein
LPVFALAALDDDAKALGVPTRGATANEAPKAKDVNTGTALRLQLM